MLRSTTHIVKNINSTSRFAVRNVSMSSPSSSNVRNVPIPHLGCSLSPQNSSITSSSKLFVGNSSSLSPLVATFSTSSHHNSYLDRPNISFSKIKPRDPPGEALKEKLKPSLPRNPTLEVNPNAPERFRNIANQPNPYTVKPERLVEIAASPSGFVPPAAEKPDLPFFINRTKTNNIPVYLNRKGMGDIHVTRIRKVQGDLKELERCVRHRLGDDHHYQVNEITSQLKIKGDHRDTLVRWFKELGF